MSVARARSCRRSSRLLAVVFCLGTGAIVAGGCRRETRAAAAPPALLCYVGGTMRPAMEELVELYRRETGQAVDMDCADSGQLLVKIRTTRKGDLYVCHDPFGAGLFREGLAAEVKTVASLTPTFVVAKGNPKGITSVRDLARPGIRVILSHWTYSTTGHINRFMFEKAGLSAEIEKNVVSITRGGSEAANAVGLGTADVAVVWNAVAHLRRDKLDVVPLTPEYVPRRDVDAVTTATFGRIDMDYVRVTVAVLAFSQQQEAARRFAAFAASDRGREIFLKHGYSAVDPTRRAEWDAAAAPVPAASAVLVHCGVGLQPPVAELARLFTEKTGTRVESSFAGSNVLLSQVELSRKGDVFIPGDSFYLDLARQKGLVGETRRLCELVPVILVARGNPRQIRGLADLAGAGLRLGLCDARACAIGRLLPELLGRSKLPATALDRNLVLNALTVSELATAVELGTVDAALVWDATAAACKDKAEAVQIPPETNLSAEVCGAVLNSAASPAAATAFLDYLASATGRGVFRRHQYRVEEPR